MLNRAIIYYSPPPTCPVRKVADLALPWLGQHRIRDRFATGIDLLSLLFAQLECYPVFGIEILGDRWCQPRCYP